jgi:signal transduction histidine kinase
LLDNIISRTKSIASSLRPPLLDDFGLLPAVSWLAENFQKKTSVTCEVESNGMTIKPGDPVDSAIFRVVQEGLLNIERHANAKNVRIILWHADGRIDVIIQDDGIGMAVGSENKTGCFGLNAMQERIFNLGGTINVKNIDPRGVAIHASIPVEPFPHTVSTS